MADQYLLLRAFVRAAKLSGDKLSPPQTPRQILESLILGRFKSEATNGRTVVSVGEGGGSTSFALPASLGPAEIMVKAEEAIQWLEQQDNPDDPDLSGRRIRRLKASFAKASL